MLRKRTIEMSLQRLKSRAKRHMQLPRPKSLKKWAAASKAKKLEKLRIVAKQKAVNARLVAKSKAR